MHYPRLAASAVFAVVAVMSSQPTRAATVQASLASTASNACQPALPAFEGVIRKRPLAVQNEGTTSAFITCSLAAGAWVKYVNVAGNSIDGQNHTINCTAVVGTLGNSRYVSKSFVVLASGEPNGFSVLAADVERVGDLGSGYVSFSCQLPPGAGLNDFYVTWDQNVGA